MRQQFCDNGMKVCYSMCMCKEDMYLISLSARRLED